MMEQRIVAAGVIIRRDSALLIKRGKNEKAYPNEWELPSGKVEYKEHPDKAAVREVKEETGLDVKVIRPLTISHFVYGKRHCVQINYLVKAKNYKVRLSEEHDDYKWVPKNKIKKFKTFKDIKEAVLEAFKH